MNDSKAAWEKLAEAVVKVGGYGEATAASGLQKAGIVYTAMFRTAFSRLIVRLPTIQV